jgi:hypothetical protein
MPCQYFSTKICCSPLAKPNDTRDSKGSFPMLRKILALAESVVMTQPGGDQDLAACPY